MKPATITLPIQPEVTLCGELAGREACVPRLLRMGFRALSVAPAVIPATKALIRTLDISDSTG
jgi:phosphoenolpyruvate-protein kinase (PTS system EI component)